MKPVKIFQHWNQQATFYPSPQCLIDSIQVQKPILVAAIEKMPIYPEPPEAVYYRQKKK